jgi:3-phosphoshikimate 1-carboxyvinyltransferase
VSTGRTVPVVPGPLHLRPRVPGSRSITNRALVCAALARGRSTLLGALWSDDTEAMLDCIRVLGARCEVTGDRIVVDGVASAPSPGPSTLFTRLSGTTSRFVLPMAALGRGEYVIDAEGPMRRRPMADGVTALRSLGVEIDDAEGHLPLVVHASELAGGEVAIAGDVSSQFLSGLLLSAPAMRDGLTVRVVGDLKSLPYVEMTASVMASFGSGVDHDGVRWRVAPTGYEGVDLAIEVDASSACYFLAAVAIVGGSVRIDGLGAGSVQGDAAFASVLAEMGCDVAVGPQHIELHREGELVGTDVDLSDMSDQAPTFGVVAAFASTPSRCVGIGFIRHKESDRVGGTVRGLRALGADADELDDGFEVRPSTLHGASIDTADDHRMAMSFALAGLRVPGVQIEDPGVVDKTYPGFWHDLEALVGEGEPT